MFEIFTTREVVFYFYTLVFIVYVFLCPKIRPSLISVIKSALKAKLVIPFILAITYAAFIVFAFTKTSFWKWIYIKEISMWILFAGVPLSFNAVSKNYEDHYFRGVIISNLKLLILVEFFISTFTFNLIIEFILQPIVLILILFEGFASVKEENTDIKKIMSWIVSITGFIILGFTIRIAVSSFSKLDAADTIVSFLIPVIFSLMYLPYAYGLAIYSKYETLFTRMSFKESKDKKAVFKYRLKVISVCWFSFKNICRFEKEYLRYMCYTTNHYELNELIDNFKSVR